MKKLLYAAAFLLFSVGAEASKIQPVLVDTTDFWQVKFNGNILVASYPKSNVSPAPGDATYFLDKVSDTDTLSILYYTDASCADCVSKIELRDKNGNVLKVLKKDFDNTPFLLAGNELARILRDNDNVYIYFTGKHKDWKPWKLLGIVTVRKL
jgi:hypothetical protein